MKCQVIGCNNEAEYWDEFSGHCGDFRRVKVAVCGNCYMGGWCIGNQENREEQVKQILSEAERI